MTKKNKNKNKKNTLRSGLLFLSAVVFFIVLSVLFKSFDTIKKSSFDGNERFTLLIKSDKNFLVSLDPLEGKSLVINLGNKSFGNYSRVLGVAIDGDLKTKEEPRDPKVLFLKTAFSFPRPNTDLTFVDYIRLFTKSGGSVNTLEIDPENQTDLEQIRTLFSDPKIVSDKSSVEIVNATGVSGIASRMARVIENMGGNVILLKNSEKIEDKSYIRFSQENYSAQKLADYFDLDKVKTGKPDIADIIIILGKDNSDPNKF